MNDKWSSIWNITRLQQILRFFPSIGNHDWDMYKTYPSKLPYLQYFSYLNSLPGDTVQANGTPFFSLYCSWFKPLMIVNHDVWLLTWPCQTFWNAGQFYTVSPLPWIQLFSLNSNLAAPGAEVSELMLHKQQLIWLQKQLQASSAAFKYFIWYSTI